MSEDVHRRTAALVLQKDPSAVTDAERRFGKALNAAFATSLPVESFIPAFEGACRALNGPELHEFDARMLFFLFCQRVLGMTAPELEDAQLWAELDEP